MRQVYRLVSDFLLPNLERKTYGKHLLWEDRKRGIFKISRIHQNSEMWSENCLEVYKAWSMKKNLWDNDDDKKITKAKHRLITALRRNPEIETLMKEDLYYRFRVVLQSNLKMKNNKERHMDKMKNPQRLRSSQDERWKFCQMDETENRWSYNDLTIISVPEKISKALVHQPNKPFFESENFRHFSWNAGDEHQRGEIMNAEKQDTQLNDQLPPGKQVLEPADQVMEHNNQVTFVGQVLVQNDNVPLEEQVVKYTDKCCCEMLLDNYLCNELCLWHGIPP